MRSRLMRFVSGLSVTSKLTAIYILDLMVTASIVVSFVGDKAAQIEFSNKERQGTAIFAPARDYYDALVRDAVAGQRDGGPPSLVATERARREHGVGMQLDPEWAGLSTATSAYATSRGADGADAAFAAAQDRLGTFLAAVGDQSNLILDPDLDSYYAMYISVVEVPAILKTVTDLARHAAQDGRDGAGVLQMSLLSAEIDRMHGEITRNLKAGADGNVDRQFMPHLRDASRRFDMALAALSAAVESNGDVAGATHDATDATFAFWRATTEELNRLLVLRVAGFYQQTFMKLGLTLGLALCVLCAVIFIGRQITRPVQRLVSVADSVRAGDPRRAVWNSADEFGNLVDAFNNMLDRLAEESQRREEIAAAGRAAEAQRDLLEAIALPVAVASLDGERMLHANAAARALPGAHAGVFDRGLEFLGRDRAADIVARLKVEGTLDEVEVELTAPDGTVSWMLLSARRVEYHKEPVGLLSLTPVNELKRAQAELGAAKEAAEVTARRLQATTETLVSGIRYASRIQNSIFPEQSAVRQLANSANIWVEQRDIVGGDWHWVGRFDDGDLIFLCDCTGHGVPGALMTMLVSAAFRRAIEDRGHDRPAQLLEALHGHVRSVLIRDSGELSADDGLDAMCIFLPRAQQIARVAGARMSLLHADRTGVHELKGDRTSIGYPSLPERVSITEASLPIRAGDTLYLFTDGCTDQMNGERRMLFGRKRLMETLDSIRDLAPGEQASIVTRVLSDYRQGEPMRDDASLIVIRVAETDAVDLGCQDAA